MSSSLVERVGLGAASASALAALLAAIVTSVVTAVLVHRLDDRRLRDAAMILAELEDDGETKSLEDIIADEIIEVQHTGILLALVDNTGKRVAGDVRVPTLHTEGCVREEGLDVCAAPTTRGVWAVSAQSATPLVGTLTFASMIAAALAALASWLGSRPFARWLIAPLLRLRDHVAGLDVRGSNLGGRSGLSEVDALRDAIEVLMKRVEAAIHTAERFAADAAHELRTPLTALRGELELFVEADPHAGMQRAAAKVVELQGLIERLLLLALPTSGSWTPPDLVAMDDLVHDVIAELGVGERVHVETDAKLPAVRGDARLLSAMVSNVLANALKFGTRAEVRMRASSDALIIEVQDDGPGVAGELRERVFEPFYRGAAHPNVPGHGLGLAVVANVVQRHNGVVSFLDTSSGACIQIRLPIA